MSSITGDDHQTAQQRTFVFVSNIPEALLRPVDASDAEYFRNHRKLQSFDPTVERLRGVIAESTTGLMRVLHTKTESQHGYALALFASFLDAMNACKAVISSPYPEDAGAPPLTMRVIQVKQTGMMREVYDDKVRIEGEVVQQDTLAATKGLMLVYRGKSTAKWCVNTLQRRDCPLGLMCSRLHLKEYQVTVKKRPRAAQATACGAAESTSFRSRLLPPRVALCASGNALPPALCKGSLAHLRTVSGLSPEAISAPQGSVAVPLCHEDLRLLLSLSQHAAAASLPDDVLQSVESLVQRTAVRFLDEWKYDGVPFFPTLSLRRSSPWDWALHHPAAVRCIQQSPCSFPPNGAPTPLERDRYIERLLLHLNQTFNRFFVGVSDDKEDRKVRVEKAIREALIALGSSPRTRASIREHFSKPSVARDVVSSDTAVLLVLEPWAPIASVLHEFVVFMKDGHIDHVLQRYGNVRYNLLPDGELVIKRIEPFLLTATEQLRKLLREERAGGDGAATVSLPKTFAARCVLVEHATNAHCIVLSVNEYDDEADESALFVADDGDGSSRDGPVTPKFNTFRHFKYELIPRETLEKLKAPVGACELSA